MTVTFVCYVARFNLIVDLDLIKKFKTSMSLIEIYYEPKVNESFIKKKRKDSATKMNA